MKYRNLGRSGLKVSTVGLGTNNFGMRLDAAGAAKVVRHALDLGVNFIDSANIYGGGRSEEYLGLALEGLRDKAIIATKVGGNAAPGPNGAGASRAHVMAQAEVSLRRLKTDYIDLYYIHFPDPSTPIEETLRALDDLVRQGKARYIGCSNYSAWQIAEAALTARYLRLNPYVCVQSEYNLLNRSVERQIQAVCEAYGLGIVPYYPLASGFLTGKYRPGQQPPEGARISRSRQMQGSILTESNFALLSSLERFAQERGHTVGDLAIAYLLANPLVGSVIAGAMTPEQLDANVKAADWELTPKEAEQAPAPT